MSEISSKIQRCNKAVNTSKPCPGKKHDMALHRSGDRLPPGSLVLADSGYQGLQKIHKKTRIPIKNTQKTPISPSSKAYNRKLSSERIVIEHKIRELKIFKILGLDL